MLNLKGYFQRKYVSDCDIQTYGTMLHSLIRNHIVIHGFEEAHYKISLAFFPQYTYARYQSTNDKQTNVTSLEKLGRHLYYLDEKDLLTASCISIATTIQTILFANGLDSNLLIGVKKADNKLFSHAWISLHDGRIIDPNNKQKNLNPIHCFSMRSQLTKWIKLSYENLDSHKEF